MKILFFGDVVGKSGRLAVVKQLLGLKRQYHPDLIIANAENLAHGKGVTLSTVQFMFDAGVDFLTSGNHVFDKPGYEEVFRQFADRIIRPANFASGYLGEGFKILEVNKQPVLVINLLGQVFMDKQVDQGEIDNPFEKITKLLEQVEAKIKICLLDFHAEATSEKRAMGFWLDGKVSAVIGTHTHVPSADAQVLPQGTGYITDVGMTGAALSVIGVDKDSALKRFLLNDLEAKSPLLVAESETYEASYVILEVDEASGKCQNINSFYNKV